MGLGDTKVNVPELIKQYRPGFALPAEFYNSREVYATDLEMIINRSWIYAGHCSELEEAGCYFLVELGQESIIVVRGEDGIVRGFANVCRHRGSRICTEARGKVRAFVCPYHAWAYELNGGLRSRRSMPADFDQSLYGLKSIKTAVYQGLIFINMDNAAGDFNASVKEMDQCLDIYGLERAKVARQETFSVDANWKLAIENFMECYHCAPAHGEYSKVHALKSPRDNEALRPAMLEEAQKLGFVTEDIDQSNPVEQGGVPRYYSRNALYSPCVTGTRNGEAVAPLMGEVPDYGGGVADIQLGPVSYGILYADHAVLYRFLPRDVQRTDMSIIWLVNREAEEGRDYDPDELTWMWRATTDSDERIILNNQRGVNSRFYEPGPLSDMEEYTRGFIDWYLRQIG